MISITKYTNNTVIIQVIMKGAISFLILIRFPPQIKIYLPFLWAASPRTILATLSITPGGPNISPIPRNCALIAAPRSGCSKIYLTPSGRESAGLESPVTIVVP